MNYRIISIPEFDKDAKRLAKKYPSLKKELSELFHSLASNPQQGDPLGNHCFKIRLSISCKGKGKSGGARVITYVYVSQIEVYLLSIYDKSEKAIISVKELKNLLSRIPI
jgi:mRNA-degrading endonuclease RelE of RelBE toxin-antitoxin system